MPTGIYTVNIASAGKFSEEAKVKAKAKEDFWNEDYRITSDESMSFS